MKRNEILKKKSRGIVVNSRSALKVKNVNYIENRKQSGEIQKLERRSNIIVDKKEMRNKNVEDN